MTVPFSILKSLLNLVILRLKFPKQYCEKTIKMDDGITFKIFRHMHLKTSNTKSTGSIFIARFKFRKFRHKTNIRLSRIPILMIAGFPGFRDKIWMIDHETDYWQGIYQFRNMEAIEKYKKSFVLAVMNKRAIRETLSYHILPDKNIDEYIRSLLID